MKSPTLLAILATLAALSLQRSYSAEIDSNFTGHVEGTVHALGVDASGRILVGGEFARINGANRNNLARLDATGTVDGAFGVQTDGSVLAITVDADGTTHVGGVFNVPSRHLVRLSPSGDLVPLDVGSSTSSRIDCLATSADGTVVFGGPFQKLNGTPAVYTGRIDAGGAIDTTFSSSLLSTMSIEAGADAIALQSDGKVIVGGNFHIAAGLATLVRLNHDGSVDATFSGDHGPILYTKAIIALENGQLLVAGVADSSGKGFVRRLNPDGSIDSSFQAPEFDDAIEAVALDADGVLIGGSFSGGLVRLESTGAVDPAWNISVEGTVKAITKHGDDAIIVGGTFQTSGGFQSGLVRIKLRGALFATNANGRFQARIQGEAGRTYEIESSPDLKAWSLFRTATATDAGIDIHDNIAAGRGQRFYRARLIE